MPAVHHRYATVDGHRLFYREAGDPDAPALVLLHGFPTSSYMFRDLVPALADRYHVIAPDHLGFGLSDAPPVERVRLHLRCADRPHRGPAAHARTSTGTPSTSRTTAPRSAGGWRCVTRPRSRRSSARTATATTPDSSRASGRSCRPIKVSRPPTPRRAVRQFLTLDATRWQYVTGVPDETLVDPESWYHDYALISRPGNDLVQLKLLRDYATNAPMYPRVHEYFRASRVPLLAVWGRGDEIFGPAGAEAFADDLPDAEIHLLDGGHFLLESALRRRRRADPRLPRQSAHWPPERHHGADCHGLDIP